MKMMNSPKIRIHKAPSSKTKWFFQTLQPITRIFGVFTAVVLCGVGVDNTVHQQSSGIYLLILSLLIFLLEIIWATTLFLRLCVRPDRHKLWNCWDCVTWLDGWKKTILYILLSTLPLIWPNGLWLSYVAAGQLLILALLYLVLAVLVRKRRKRKILHLLGQGDGDSSFESSNRFEEVTEVLDDSLPEQPIAGSSHSLSDCPDTILEI